MLDRILVACDGAEPAGRGSGRRLGREVWRLKGLLLGSVSSKVSSLAECPMLTVS